MTTRPPILVTGGAGYVGRHVLARLSAAGLPLRVLVHRAAPPAGDWETVRGDVVAPQPSWFDGVSAVVHLAACTRSRRPDRHYEVNALATSRMVQIVRGLREPPLFVHASSIAAGGPGRTTGLEALPCDPTTHYGRSKLLAEHAVLSLPRRVVLRLPMVYGGDDRSLARLALLRRLRVFPVSSARFSGVCIDDVCGILLDLLQGQGSVDGVHAVSDGQEYSLAAIADRIVDSGRPLLRIPLGAPGLLPLIELVTGNPDAIAYLRQDWVQAPSPAVASASADLYSRLELTGARGPS